MMSRSMACCMYRTPIYLICFDLIPPNTGGICRSSPCPRPGPTRPPGVPAGCGSCTLHPILLNFLNSEFSENLLPKPYPYDLHRIVSAARATRKSGDRTWSRRSSRLAGSPDRSGTRPCRVGQTSDPAPIADPGPVKFGPIPEPRSI